MWQQPIHGHSAAIAVVCKQGKAATALSPAGPLPPQQLATVRTELYALDLSKNWLASGIPNEFLGRSFRRLWQRHP